MLYVVPLFEERQDHQQLHSSVLIVCKANSAFRILTPHLFSTFNFQVACSSACPSDCTLLYRHRHRRRRRHRHIRRPGNHRRDLMMLRYELCYKPLCISDSDNRKYVSDNRNQQGSPCPDGMIYDCQEDKFQCKEEL